MKTPTRFKHILILCLTFPPIGLYFLWKSNEGIFKKIILTPISGFCAFLILGIAIQVFTSKETKQKWKEDKAQKDLLKRKEEKNNILLSFKEQLERTSLLELDPSYSETLNKLKSNVHFQSISNKKKSIKNLRLLTALTDIQRNLTIKENGNVTNYETTITPEIKNKIYEDSIQKEFVLLNFQLIQKGGYPKEIILAIHDFAIHYGYWGNYKKEIGFKHYLIQALVEYGAKNKKLLNLYCEALDEGIVSLDNIENHVYYRFSNRNTFNKHLKLFHPSSPCYIDYEALAKEQSNDFTEDCLRAYDGSCHSLTQAIKESMLDPDSFEHIETSFYNKDEYALVVTQYRGKNAFGAKVFATTKAKVSWDCEVIEILE